MDIKTKGQRTKVIEICCKCISLSKNKSGYIIPWAAIGDMDSLEIPNSRVINYITSCSTNTGNIQSFGLYRILVPTKVQLQYGFMIYRTQKISPWMLVSEIHKNTSDSKIRWKLIILSSIKHDLGAWKWIKHLWVKNEKPEQVLVLDPLIWWRSCIML